MRKNNFGVQRKNNEYHIFYEIDFFQFLGFFRCKSSYYEGKIGKFYLQVNYFKWAKTTNTHFLRKYKAKTTNMPKYF